MRSMPALATKLARTEAARMSVESCFRRAGLGLLSPLFLDGAVLVRLAAPRAAAAVRDGTT